MERERRVWGAKRGAFGRARHEMGTKGSKRGEKEGRDGSSSHCIPTRHIPVHIWLQYTRSPLLTIPHSLSQTHRIWRSLTRICRICTGTQHIKQCKLPLTRKIPMYLETLKSFFFHQWICLRKVLIISSLSYQASFQQSCSGGTVGWLRVAKAALLPRWLSAVACSHTLPRKPDPSIYRHTHMCSHTQRNRKYRED